MAALQGLRDSARLEGGQHVLINGASGGVGTFAVQIAKAMGAEVTAVVSTRNAETPRSIGADHVIDYRTTDFTLTESHYDVIFDLVGTRRVKDLLPVLAPKGTLVMASGSDNRWIGPLARVLGGLIRSVVIKKRIVAFAATTKKSDLEALTKLIESDQIAPQISATFELEEVPEALRKQGQGHAQGKTVITVGSQS